MRTISSSSSSSTFDPSKELPRDSTGSYLHLKLKRYPSPYDLKMAYAKQSWRDHPHDAEVEVSTTATSKCRYCHRKIDKGELRVRLWLQCHKGCKNSAYFHGNDCIWKYPETTKLESAKELVGIDSLPDEQQKYIHDQLERLMDTPNIDDNDGDNDNNKKTKTKSTGNVKRTLSGTSNPKKRMKKSTN